MTMAEDLPEGLRARLAAVAETTGRPVLVLSRHWPDPRLRGRVTQRAGALVLEYRDEGAGYFWHLDLIAELLSYVEQGHLQISLHDPEDTRLLAELFREGKPRP
jgi:hypothetical protein